MRNLLLVTLLTVGLWVGCGNDDPTATADSGNDLSTTDGVDDDAGVSDGNDIPDSGTTTDGGDAGDVDGNDQDSTTDDDATDLGGRDGDADGSDDTGGKNTESVCDNNMDDDMDDLIDCDDPDCELSEICAPVCKAVTSITCSASITAQNSDEGSTNIFAEYSCEDYLYTGPEIAWSFSVDKPTHVTVLLDNESDDTDILIIENANDLCFAKQCIASGLKSAVFLAQPNSSYSLVVDGYQGSIGSFDMQVICEACTPNCGGKVCGGNGCGGICGTCAAGKVCSPDQNVCLSPPPEDVCESAEEINALPFTTLGDSSEALDNYNALGVACLDTGTGGGADVVYSFTPSSTDIFQVALSELTFDAALYVVSDCGAVAQSCQAGAESFDDESLELGLKAGVTYYIIVDGVDSLESGMFQLDVFSLGPCTPQCDGCGNPDGCGDSCPCDAANDTCEQAIAIDLSQLPLTIEGTTLEAADDYSAPETACPNQSYQYGDGGSDVVYSITPTKSDKYTFSIPLTGADFDASLYVVSDCSDIADSCVAGSETIGLGGESITVSLEANTSYYVIVDGYKANQGNFTLEVVLCTANCTGKSCGSDGCGGICGECDATKNCFEGQCIEPGCNGITFEGCCQGNKLVYCTGDEMVSTSCNESCGWNNSSEWYECGSEGEDPSGQFPYVCPNF